MKLLRILGLAGIVLLASCASPGREARPPAPAPAPAIAPRPAPAPAALPAPTVAWIDAPLGPGDWTYEGSAARYGPAGVPSFAIRCAAPGQIVLVRTGTGGTSMTIRASNAMRTLPARATGGSVEAQLAATDPLLDAIAYSRGRFSVEVPGLDRLIVPSWPEPARVVEDCRAG